MRLAVVTSGFPRISETFALNELVAMQARGLLAGVFATKGGDWSAVQPQVRALRPLVTELPPGDSDEQAAALVRSLDGRQVSAVHGYFAHEPAAVAARAAELLVPPVRLRRPRRRRPPYAAPRPGGPGAGARLVLTCNRETAR